MRMVGSSTAATTPAAIIEVAAPTATLTAPEFKSDVPAATIDTASAGSRSIGSASLLVSVLVSMLSLLAL